MHRIFFLSLLIPVFLSGCKDNSLPPEEISHIPVIRFVEDKTVDPMEASELTGNQGNVPVMKPVNSVKKPARQKQPVYHIIVASFTYGERNKAEKLVRDLKGMGYPAQLLEAKGRVRVSIESFTSEAEARSQRKVYIEDTDKQDIWILELS